MWFSKQTWLFFILIPTVLASRTEPVYAFFAIKGGYKSMYYAAPIFVGAKEQLQTVIIDTGSDLMAFPCAICKPGNCGTHEDSYYEYHQSSTFHPIINCPPDTRDRETGACKFQNKYMEGSAVSGIRAQEFFKIKREVKDSGLSVSSLAADKRVGSVPLMAEFGCTTKETGEFLNQSADGIMGLDPKSSFIRSVEDQEPSNPKVMAFGMCFGREGGHMSFELFPRTNLPNLASSQSYLLVDIEGSGMDYNVVLERIVVGKEEVSGENMRATFDTGTTMTLFPKKTAEAVFAALTAHCRDQPDLCGKMTNPEFKEEWCIELRKEDSDFASLEDALATFPTIHLMFEGANMPYHLRPENYMYLTSEGVRSTRACIAISGDPNLTRMIIGGFAMINHFVYFDRPHNMMVVDNHVDCTEPPKRITRSPTPPSPSGLMNVFHKIGSMVSGLLSNKS